MVISQRPAPGACHYANVANWAAPGCLGRAAMIYDGGLWDVSTAAATEDGCVPNSARDTANIGGDGTFQNVGVFEMLNLHPM